VILSVALLSMLAATLAAHAGLVRSTQVRQQDRLACTELASRLLLQYIDGKETMPSPGLPLEYGPRLYRWSLDEARVVMRLNPAALAAADKNITADRIVQATVRVWLAEDSGGSVTYTDAVPHATLTRLVDPLALKNPDTIEKQFNTPEGLQKFLNQVLDAQQGRTGPEATP
jgi:hypothetical protein